MTEKIKKLPELVNTLESKLTYIQSCFKENFRFVADLSNSHNLVHIEFKYSNGLETATNLVKDLKDLIAETEGLEKEIRKNYELWRQDHEVWKKYRDELEELLKSLGSEPKLLDFLPLWCDDFEMWKKRNHNFEVLKKGLDPELNLLYILRNLFRVEDNSKQMLEMIDYYVFDKL